MFDIIGINCQVAFRSDRRVSSLQLVRDRKRERASNRVARVSVVHISHSQMHHDAE